MLAGETKGVNLVYLRLKNPSLLSQVKTQIARELSGVSVTSSDSFLELMGGVSKISDQFSLLASLVALGGAYFPDHQNHARQPGGAFREIGILKAVGWTEKDVQINIQLSHFSADGGSMTMNRYILSHNRNQRSRKWFAIIPWAVLFVLGSGAAGWEMAGGQESPLSSFGSGTIKVRLYTDYFCSPCRDMEPDLEPLLLGSGQGRDHPSHLYRCPRQPAHHSVCPVFSLCFSGEKGF